MTNDERMKINILQKQGFGYKRIAALTGLNPNTVKSYCKTHPVCADKSAFCLQCGEALTHTPKKRKKKFCSDVCRAAWWSAHPEERKSSRYSHVCAFCGSEFHSDRPASRYCSTLCFANARKKVTQHGD